MNRIALVLVVLLSACGSMKTSLDPFTWSDSVGNEYGAVDVSAEKPAKGQPGTATVVVKGPNGEEVARIDVVYKDEAARDAAVSAALRALAAAMAKSGLGQ